MYKIVGAQIVGISIILTSKYNCKLLFDLDLFGDSGATDSSQSCSINWAADFTTPTFKGQYFLVVYLDPTAIEI